MAEKERLKNREFSEWNEAMVRKYDPESYHLHSGFIVRYIEKLRVDAIRKAIKSQAGDRILEVGVGAGNVLEKIGEGQLTGIDLSETVLLKAKTRLKNRQAILIKADAEILPFCNNVFHKVICTEVLEHVHDPKKVIAEISRVSKPDAIVVISIPNERMINRIKKLVFGLHLNTFFSGRGYSVPDRMDDEWHLHTFDLKLLRESLQGQLSIIKVRSIPCTLLPLRYVVICNPIQKDKSICI